LRPKTRTSVEWPSGQAIGRTGSGLPGARNGCRLGRVRGLSGGCRLNMLPYRLVFLTFWLTLTPSMLESVFAEECLTAPQQLLQKKLSDRWKELHQKDNQPLFLTISAGQGDKLHFVGKKPDGSTWISGAMSICPSLGNKYQVKLDRIDQAPLLVGLKLRGMTDTIVAGSSHLKFGAGQHCGNPDPCIEFGPE